MKRIKTTVRWFDGFKRDFFPVEYEFGNSYLQMKFEEVKQKLIDEGFQVRVWNVIEEEVK